MSRSPRHLLLLAVVVATLALALAPAAPESLAAPLDGEQIIALPCARNSTVFIASLGPAGTANLDVYNSNGRRRQTHGGLDFGIDGATSVDLSLPQGFLGSCVVSADTSIAAIVVQSNPGGSKTPIGLPASTTRGSDFLVNVVAIAARTVTSEVLFMNPTGGPVGVDNFCNDASNNSVSVSHWDINPFANLLMDPFLDPGPLLVDLDLTCAQVFRNSGADDQYQDHAAWTRTNYDGSGDRLFAPGVLLADLIGKKQYLPIIHGAADGSSRTALKIHNIGPGDARVVLRAYKPNGNRAGKKTIKVAESTSTRIDSVTDDFDWEPLIVVTATAAKGRSVVTEIVDISVITDDREVGTIPDGSEFGAYVPTYTTATAIAERAAIPGISFEVGDAVRFGVANAGTKTARVRVRVMSADGTTHLDRRLKVRKNGSASLEIPGSLAGRTLHVLVDVLRKGPVMPYVEELRVSGEMNFYAAQPFTPGSE